MSVSDENERITVTISKDDVIWMDEIGARFKLSRSQVIAKCIDSGREELRWLDKLFMRPEKIIAIVDGMHSRWSWVKAKVSIVGDRVGLGREV